VRTEIYNGLQVSRMCTKKLIYFAFTVAFVSVQNSTHSKLWTLNCRVGNWTTTNNSGTSTPFVHWNSHQQ